MPRSTRGHEVRTVGAREDPSTRHPPEPEEPGDGVGDGHGTAPQQALVDRDGEDDTGALPHLDIGPARRLDIVVHGGALGAEPTPPVGTNPELLVAEPVADGGDRHRVGGPDAADELRGRQRPGLGEDGPDRLLGAAVPGALTEFAPRAERPLPAAGEAAEPSVPRQLRSDDGRRPPQDRGQRGVARRSRPPGQQQLGRIPHPRPPSHPSPGALVVDQRSPRPREDEGGNLGTEADGTRRRRELLVG